VVWIAICRRVAEVGWGQRMYVASVHVCHTGYVLFMFELETACVATSAVAIVRVADQSAANFTNVQRSTFTALCWQPMARLDLLPCIARRRIRYTAGQCACVPLHVVKQAVIACTCVMRRHPTPPWWW
jgi:hypothetical protein